LASIKQLEEPESNNPLKPPRSRVECSGTMREFKAWRVVAPSFRRFFLMGVRQSAC